MPAYRRSSLLAAAMVLLALILPARGQTTALPVKQVTPGKVSKFAAMEERTGVMFRIEEVPLTSARADGILAFVVRMEEVTSHEVAYSFQVKLHDVRGRAVVSEEELNDLKDCVDYISQNAAKLNDSPNPVRVEYRSLSNASFGYMVHRRAASDQEWPPTAYVEIPENPLVPQSGGVQQVPTLVLQRVVAEAQKTMSDLQGRK
jgi:hypothetical protein